MIKKVSVCVDKNEYTPNAKPNFSPNFQGLGRHFANGMTKFVQRCEKQPMLNVAVLDLSTAIIPRTCVETVVGSKKKDENGNPIEGRKFNFLAGFEAFRREFSGLLINCLIPGFVVMGFAKLLNRPVFGKEFNKSNLAKSWANGDSINKIQDYLSSAKGSTKKDKVCSVFRSMLNDVEGIDGDIAKGGLKRFKDLLAHDTEYEKILEKLADNVLSDKPDSKVVKEAFEKIVAKTGISENIRFKGDKGFFSNNLRSLLDGTTQILHGVTKEGIENNHAQIEKYLKKGVKLVNIKSILGLISIIGLAISAQPINRWITHKVSGKQGAPIYNDDKERILNPDEKKSLILEKFFAVPLMAGVAALSMIMDKPSLKMFQFKGIFPTMDQARLISAATFCSRIASAEDSNELKENTIRDIATFSSFYFLGDYVAKGIATLLQKKNNDVQLINYLKKTDENSNVLKRFWNWAKHSKIKSSDELTAIKDAALRNKNIRFGTLCQLGSMAFSLLALGLFIPLYTRTQTNKNELERKLASGTKPAGTEPSDSTGATFGASQAKMFEKPKVFEQFLNS